MKIDANDPRWTAYALGELGDEKERAELETILKESAEMRRLVEEIRETAAWLDDGLKTESFEGLTGVQRERIESQATGRRSWFMSKPVWALSGIAAALILGISVWMSQLQDGTTGPSAPDTQIAELREDSVINGPVLPPVNPAASDTDTAVPDTGPALADIGSAVPDTNPVVAETVNKGPKVTIPSQSVTVISPAEEEPVLAAAESVKRIGRTKSTDTTSPNIRLVTLEGIIRDSSNKGIAMVTVTATNADTAMATTTVTDSSGVYVFAGLEPGKYTVTAEHDGFRKDIKTNLALSEADTNRLDFELQPSGSIRMAALGGLIEDTAQGILSGVQVTATNEDTNVKTTVLSNNKGEYNFPVLAPGKYSLSADLDGFMKKTFVDVNLGESSKNKLDFELEVAGLATNLEVVTTAQDILTESSSSTGTVLSSDQVVDLPLTENDVTALVNVMGGVQSPPPEGLTNLGTQSYAGVDASALNIQQDGLTVNDTRHKAGINSNTAVNPEMVGEFKMILSPVEAEYGRGNGQVQILTRDGPGKEEAFRRRGRRPFPPPRPGFNTEGYANVVDNPFMEVVQNPLSTFSIDVDTASYANVRRFIERGQLPPPDAVRIEELVNYFDYDYKGPGREGPFAAHFEMTAAPWNPEHRLLRIGLKAKEMKNSERPPTNLVFLIDVSGSMSDYNKLPLVKDSMHMLIDQLTDNDRVAIVTYAGSTRVELTSTNGSQKWQLHQAVDRLHSGGSTNGASGIQLAYDIARVNYISGGANRVILATDGDFNVGITNHGDLTRLIEEKADSGVYLSALGFGMGNYKDNTLELLADKGRGNYAYIDSIREARKVLVEQMNATIVGVAKDVKIQVEFNPGKVGAYRLIGYEDRIMPKEDFNNDARKAGVIGAGHAVTALYEIVPAGMPIPSPGVDPLKYQKPVEKTGAASSDEVATVKIRYKEAADNKIEADGPIAAKQAELKSLLSKYTPNHPKVVQVARELEHLQAQSKGIEGEKSKLMEFTVRDSDRDFKKASEDFKFAASVAAFGMILRDSPYKGTATLVDALSWAKDGLGKDEQGYRTEYIRLLGRAVSLQK